MNGKEFEAICLDRLKGEEKQGRATMVRYGVQGSYRKGEAVSTDEMRSWAQQLGGKTRHAEIIDILQKVIDRGRQSADAWQPIQSLPDFTGVLARRGQAFDFDAKVCGDASLNLHSSKFAERQLRYLLKRSQFGAICFVLIHFTERELAKGKEAAVTWAFPIKAGHPFWESVAAGEIKRINRQHCEKFGVLVPWDCMKGGRTPRPNIVEAVRIMAEMPVDSADPFSWKIPEPEAATPF